MSRQPSKKASGNFAAHLADARRKFGKGCYLESLRACHVCYALHPSNIDNLLLLAACHFQLNRLKEAIFYASQALEVDPKLVEAHIVLGNALGEQGNADAASDLYRKAFRLQPRSAAAYAGLGAIHYRQGRLKDAIGCFEMAITLDPSFETNLGLVLIAAGDKPGGKAHLTEQPGAIARLSLGNLAHEEGDFDAAIEHYSQALRKKPDFIDAATNLCGSQIESFKTTNDRNTLHEAQTRLEQIIASFKTSQSAHCKLGICHRLEGRHKLAHQCLWRAVTLDPTNADALCNLAALHTESGEHEQVVRLCLRALEFNPSHAQAFGTLGIALFHMGLVDDAVQCLRMASRLEPAKASFSSNYGSVLCQMGNFIAAAKLLKRSIAVDPFNMPAFLNLGNAYFYFGSVEYAEKCYQTCIEANTECSVIAMNNLALLYLSQDKLDQAIGVCVQLRQRLDPSSVESSATLAIIDAYACDWTARTKSFDRMLAADNVNETSIHPFFAQIAPHMIPPETALSMSNSFSRRVRQRALHQKDGAYCHVLPEPGSPITIGYVSSGFGSHTTNFLFRGIIGKHDRSKFQVLCFALAPPPSDDCPDWTALRDNADLLVDLSKMSFVDAADEIHRRDVHVLVDLDGRRHGARPEIFALRPAPVQITASCETTGSESGIDYVVGDEHSIPERHRSHFSEEVVYVPHVANGHGEASPVAGNLDRTDRSELRRRHSIPDDAFVYACFSEPWKIDPELFAAWMDVLREVPNSRLALLSHSDAVEENLRREASHHDVDADRLVFLDVIPRRDHRARCRVADVFLDARLCGDVVAGCDALCSAAPLIAIAGDRTSSRIGGSLLTSLGAAEFVASDLEGYKELAVALSARDGEELIDVVHFLDDARDGSSLFDCEVWARAFEDALATAVERRRRGLKPEAIERQHAGLGSVDKIDLKSLTLE